MIPEIDEMALYGCMPIPWTRLAESLPILACLGRPETPLASRKQKARIYRNGGHTIGLSDFAQFFPRIAYDSFLGPCTSIGDSCLLRHTNPFVARLLDCGTARQIRLLQKRAYRQVDGGLVNRLKPDAEAEMLRVSSPLDCSHGLDPMTQGR